MKREILTTKDFKKDILTVPNIITLGRILGTIYLIFYLVTRRLTPLSIGGITSPWHLPLLAALIVLTDTLDGFIARKFNCSSELGGTLDAVADKIFNWGLALTLFLTGLFPIKSILLLAPTLIRDLFVASITIIDKIEDGKFKQKRKKGIKSAFLEGDAMCPTILGKLKMWPMSIAIISGLRYTFVLSQNMLFIVMAILADLLSVADMFVVSKNYLTRKKGRTK